jgi:1-acyl-sn-glycerol-3-phosphate acyltransferase
MSDAQSSISMDQCPQHLRGNRSALTRWCGRAIFSLLGWRLEGQITDAERVILTAAPHTSNWDAVLGFAAALGLNVRLFWLGKHSIFIPGLRWLMRWLGGIPVNRKNPEDVMEYVNQAVEKHQGLVIIVAPEGTRKKAEKWKTGFLRIAKMNDCKIQLGALDFPTKRIIIGDVFEPSGDNHADLETIKDWYKQYEGKFPDQF